MSDLLYKLDKTSSDIETLLLEHKRLVYYMLKTFNQLHNQDAESAAWEALWDSLNLFDVFSNTPFASYACVLIGNAIKDVLRKQSREYEQQNMAVEQLIEKLEDAMIEEFNVTTDNVKRFYEHYISMKTGLVRDIMVAWEAADFDTNPTNIGRLCRCSPSYVSRVQRDFRAYLSDKLRDL